VRSTTIRASSAQVVDPAIQVRPRYGARQSSAELKRLNSVLRRGETGVATLRL
jgi:hypothetical protein